MSERQDAARYRIEELLGVGGMGQVYRALDETLGRRVALKFLRARSEEELRRMRREARTQARVQHPNVASVYEAGELDGKPFISMEYVDGETLAELAEHLDLTEKLEIVRDVARAVQAGHELGLIHRDLKPSNVLLERRDDAWHPVVVDFGLATEIDDPALTATGRVMGTPTYMSPEQLHGERSRSIDVYALGAILYELLSGRPPYEGESGVEILLKVSRDDPLPLRRVAPTLPEELVAVVEKAMARDLEIRYPSVRLLADDLDRYLRGVPVAARPASLVYRFRKWVSRNRGLAAGGLVAVLTLGGAGTWGVLERARSLRQTDIARELGEQAESIEWNLRAVEMAPRHDVSRERSRVGEQLETIRSRAQSSGGMVAGPAQYALGRGYLALGDSANARRALQSALAAGFERPEVRFALGAALASLYQTRRADAARIRDPDLRALRLRAIDRELRQPAIVHLRAGLTGATLPSPYVRALLGFLEQRYEESIENAKKAEHERSWLYEASLLRGEAERARGDRARDRGEYELAEAAYGRADQAYQRAATVAESSFEARRARCALWAAVLDMRIYQSGGDLESPYAQGRAACEAATAILPGEASGWIRRSALQRLAGGGLRRTGSGDPIPRLEKALEWARRAVELDPDDAAAHRAVGLALRERALWESSHGKDPRPSLRLALTSYRRAAELRGDAVDWSNLGLAESSLARQEAFRGESPSERFEQAVEDLERAVSMAPDFAPVHLNLGEVLKNEGLYLLDHGEPSEATFRSAIDAFSAALDRNPEYALAWRSLGIARWYLGDAMLQRGADPRPTLQASLHALAEARRIDPDNALHHSDAANVRGMLARYAMDHGRDPREHLRIGLERLKRARELNPDLVWPLFIEGVIHRDWAEYLLETGEESEPELEAAREAFRRALDRHESIADGHTDLAAVEILAAESSRRAGESPMPFLDRADAELDRALEIDPTFAPAHRWRGEARLVEARWLASTSPSGPTTALEAAEAALRKAWRENDAEAPVPDLLAEVFLLRARLAEAPDVRRELAREGLHWVDRALELRPDDADGRVLHERLTDQIERGRAQTNG